MTTPTEVLTNPTPPDPPPKLMAVVLTKKRIVRQGMIEYHVPAGSVIHTRMLPHSTTFNAGSDTRLIEAGSLKAGDFVEG